MKEKDKTDSIKQEYSTNIKVNVNIKISEVAFLF